MLWFVFLIYYPHNSQTTITKTIWYTWNIMRNPEEFISIELVHWENALESQLTTFMEYWNRLKNSKSASEVFELNFWSFKKRLSEDQHQICIPKCFQKPCYNSQSQRNDTVKFFVYWMTNKLCNIKRNFH